MPITLDRPPVKLAPDDLVVIARPRKRGFLARYQQHLWLAGLSILILGVALSPLAMGYLGRQPVESKLAAAAVPASSLATNVTVTASEFKFSPTSIQVPLGQKI